MYWGARAVVSHRQTEVQSGTRLCGAFSCNIFVLTDDE